LITIDLDGTLIDESLEVSAADRAAIRKALAAGASICLATGRLFAAAEPFARTLGLRGPIIVLQGSAVYDLSTQALVHCVPLAPATALRAYQALKRSGFHLQLYFGDTLFVDRVDDRAERYIALARVKPTVVKDLRALLDGAPPPAPGPMKVLGIDDEAKVAAMIAQLGAELGAAANVFKSQPTYLEVTDRRADKGTALRWVADSLDVPLARTAAIGDSDNDVPMLEIAGYAFAVGNATPAAKAAARTVVAAQSSNGVSDAIARLLAQGGDVSG